MRFIRVCSLITLLLGVPFPAMAQAPEPASPIAASGDFAGLVDIGGGRRMFLQCRGQGGPTVVLVSGYDNTGGAWSVLPEGIGAGRSARRRRLHPRLRLRPPGDRARRAAS